MNLQFRTPGDNDEEKDDDKVNPIELAKERLLSVEVAIERRYLKAPLGQNKGDLVQSVLSGSCPSADPPKALLTWREAVRRCETAAQVSMCFYVLETSVAWDKSIMKASCQFCHSGDKEDQLLLCDGCDKGYHTYCFRPPMDNIPDGDWFCYECRNKATGQRNCIVCGKAGSKASSVLCDQCPKAYHIECLQPPLAKVIIVIRASIFIDLLINLKLSVEFRCLEVNGSASCVMPNRPARRRVPKSRRPLPSPRIRAAAIEIE